jgi:hypothetical protein
MPRGSKKYQIPLFLEKIGIHQADYGAWLDRITVAHSVRDKHRLKKKINREAYRKAIHAAVEASNGYDVYTGEKLDFHLLEYFAGAPVIERAEKEVPTLDHVILDADDPKFAFCSLRTNKCKADLLVEELVEFCTVFLAHQKKKNS